MSVFLVRKSKRNMQEKVLHKFPDFYITVIFSVIVVGLLFLCFRSLSPFIYQTNDDLFLKMLASGEMCGNAQAHLLHISYPVGLILAGLYTLFPYLSWYGLFFCLVIGLSMTVILYHLLLVGKSLPGRLLTILLYGIFCYGFLFLHISELQFTTVAAMAGCGALFRFVLVPNTEFYHETFKNNGIFLGLSVCAFCIRANVLLMLFPFIGMIGLGKYLDAGKSPSISFFRLNKQRKCLIVLVSAFMILLALFYFLDNLAYKQEDWHSFYAYNEARATIYDYEGYPDYDTYNEVYQELGLSRSSYEAAAYHYSIALDPNINLKAMEVLEDIAIQGRQFSFSQIFNKLQEMAEFFVDRHMSYMDRPLNLLVYCCYILFFFCGVLCRKRTVLRDILFLGFARMIIWTYLLFYGRLPTRVSQSIYLAEFVILLAIVLRNRVWELQKVSGDVETEKKKEGTIKKIFWERFCSAFWIASIVFLTFVCLRFGFPKARAAAGEASSRLQFSQSFVDVRNYCHTHPDNFYYLDMHSFEYFTEDALQIPACEYDNFLYLGSWISNSPWYDIKFQRAGITDPAAALYEDPNVFVVFMDAEGISYDYLQDFYTENYFGVTLEVVETLEVSNGLQFFIIKGHVNDSITQN